MQGMYTHRLCALCRQALYRRGLTALIFFIILKFTFMPKQEGVVPLRGTMGNITFYRSQDGFLARQKGSLTASRIASDPAFARTRENGAEFSRAGKAGKLLRTALRSLLLNSADSRMIPRLTRELMRVIQSDTTNPRGLRTASGGDLLLLEGFDFNRNSQLSSTLFAPYSPVTNRVSGELSITVPPFVPANMIAAPAGATHFKLVAAGMLIDFEQQRYEIRQTETAELLLDPVLTDAITLQHLLPANSTQPLFLAMGIQFFQFVNGGLYPLKNGAFNSLTLVEVDLPV
jgi:hypothetical protein